MSESKDKQKNDHKPSTKLRKKIYQSNPLIQAKKGMNILELRLFTMGLQGVNPHLSSRDKFYDEDFKLTYISCKKLRKIFNNPWYLHDLEKICDKMFDGKIKLRYEDGGFKLMHIFETMEYKPSDGLYIKFDKNMRPYLLDLMESGGYTQLTVSQIFNLSSPYAWRLVELLLQFRGTKKNVIERTITIEDLRYCLNIPDEAYAGRIDNFRKFILDEPIEEINSKTSYVMSYGVVKKGRRVAAFAFKMDTSKVIQAELEAKEAAIRAKSEEQDIISRIMSYGIKEEAARQLWNLCKNTEDCKSRLEYAEKELIRQSAFRVISNKAGFIVKAIKENWFQKSKETAEGLKNPQNSPERRYWIKLMRKYQTASEEAIKEITGIKRMLNEEEISMVQRGLLDGGFNFETKEMLSDLGWDYGLAVSIFSLNNDHYFR